MKRSTRNFIFTLIIDFTLLWIALIAVQYIKRGDFYLSELYWSLFKLFFITWIIVSLFMKKFRILNVNSWYEGMLLITKSNLAILFIISFSIIGLHLIPVSRGQTFGSCLMFFVLESAVYTLYCTKITDGRIEFYKGKFSLSKGRLNLSYQLFVLDAVVLFISFFVVNFIKRGDFVLRPDYDQILMILFAIWLPVSLITYKFDRSNFQDFYNGFSPCVKAVFIMAAVLSFIVFAFRLFFYSRLQIFGTLVVFFVFEAGLFRLYYLYRKFGKNLEDVESIEQRKAAIGQQDLTIASEEEDIECVVSDPVKEKLKYALEFFDPKLFDFVRDKINLSEIDRCNTAVMSTDDLANIQALDNNGLNLLVNLHKVNDVRWFNRYFLEVHSKLTPNGYFIGKVHTIQTHREYFLKKFAGPFVELLYALDFIWRRIFPKLPLTKKLYFTITRGRNRMVSKAEIFGRLYFCGFRIIAEEEMANRLYFIVKKVKMPSLDENPTYGPIVSLNRTGYNGNYIKVYKFRTMHPYSEYIQDFVFEKSNLQKGGKFSNDFRVTSWGRFMRATWLDELPMIYNWIKGDLQLFGVRPLSRQYYNLYTDELKELRKKVKPGLIPPYYADLPESLSEIMESEIRYIRRYLDNPLRTQITYLWRSFINIVIKGARSH